MSWLKKLGKGISKAASFVPGPIGIAGSAGNALLNNKNVGKALVGDMARNSKFAAAALPVAMTAGAAVPALGSAMGTGALGATGAAAKLSGVAGGGGGAIGKAAGGLSKLGIGAGDLIDLGLAGFSAYQGRKADKRAERADQQALAMQQQALKFAQDQYAERAPFRKLGTSMALDQQPEDVSALFASSNPFARRRRTV